MTTFRSNPAALPDYLPASVYAPQLEANDTKKAKRTFGDKYLFFLGLVLIGYAIGDKGFAYWGVSPIFIGEITLGIGMLFLALRMRLSERLLSIRAFIPLLIFMLWGVCCTVPYIGKYGFDALRDSVIYMYGLFAFLVAGLFIEKPERLRRVVPWFRKLTTAYLIIAPYHLVAEHFNFQLPQFPGSDYPIISAKGGDIAVHLVGAFACATIFGGISPFLVYLVIPVCAALCMVGRAALVTMMFGWTVFLALKPTNSKAWSIFGMMFLGLIVMWAIDFRIGDKGESKTVSADYLVTALDSIFGTSKKADLEGTKEWRMRWWSEIRHYTFGDEKALGKFFWTGKGFGINLSVDDGFVVDEGSLRSPHNGHMTVLARSGVPGFCLWVTLHAIWVLMMLNTFMRAKKHGDRKWQNLIVATLVYWIAFMTNASFDVFIEGPMGGVWLWCLHGFGIAICYLYRRDPRVLDVVPQQAMTSIGMPAMNQMRVGPMAAPIYRGA